MDRIKWLFGLCLLALAVLCWQCQDLERGDTVAGPDVFEKGGRGGGGGGGGNGGGGNGGPGGGGSGGGELFGDLLVVLRNADGVPDYMPIDDEHGTSYYPLPIKHDEITELPVPDAATRLYETFALDIEGDMVPEAGFIAKEVEFGRLNLTRSPQRVLDQAMDEVLNTIGAATVTDVKTDASGRLVVIHNAEDWMVNIDDDPANDEFDDKTIDSPRENMAIYQELMTYQFTRRLTVLSQFGFSDADFLFLAAGALAAGSDKTGFINVDEVCYLNEWLLDWDNVAYPMLDEDINGRHYLNFRGVTYNRGNRFGGMYVKETELLPDGTWQIVTKQLMPEVGWTSPAQLVDYSGGMHTNVTGFAEMADDAVQVIQYLHDHPLVEYNPYFTPSTP